VLKDVFDYSLEEIAELVDSTVGGMKAALVRGRAKLTELHEGPGLQRSSGVEKSTSWPVRNDELSRLLHLYMDRFNRRDWDGLRDLIAADARLCVADRFAGRLVDSPYFGRYERWSVAWRLTVGELDGEPTLFILQRDAGDWTPTALVRLDVEDGRITRITDYSHCPWILPSAASLTVSEQATRLL
jgi:RNA polymerase sigma-70 factor, ECF subfamily